MIQLEEIVPYKRLSHEILESKEIRFDQTDFPSIPKSVGCSSVELTLRERFADSGLIDSVVISLSALSSFHIAQFLIGICFSADERAFVIETGSSEGLRKIVFESGNSWDLSMRLERLAWRPHVGIPSPFGSKMRFRVSHEDDDFLSKEKWANRSLLYFSGGIGGNLLFANELMKLATIEMNYETIHHRMEPSPHVERNSCELRIEKALDE